MPRLKFFVLRHQWWLLILATVGAVATLARWPQPLSINLTILGVVGSVFYFLQRQALEEIALFRELFKEFNTRYDNMNERLSDILNAPTDKPISTADRKLLVDYFNLCGEEYFYYSRGFIDPIVWDSWRNGVKQYMGNSRIRDIWREESESDSYYGLKL